MKLNLKIILISLIMSICTMYANGDLYSLGFWKFKSINGSILLESNYREQENLLSNNFYDKQQSASIYGNFKLRTNTYFWHENFCLFDANIEYSPNAIREDFLVMPNRTETTNAENIGFNLLFFNNRPLSFNFSYNKGISYSLRDYGTSVMNEMNTFGSSVFFKNSIAPASLSYNTSSNEERYLSNSKTFRYDSNTLSGNISNMINGTLENKISFSNNNYVYNYDTSNISDLDLFEFKVDNKLIINKLNDEFVLSNFTYYNQLGNINQNKIIENLTYRKKFLDDFKLRINYMYDKTNYDSLTSTTQNLSGRLEHQLFKSLLSYTNYQYFNSNQFSSEETRNQFALGFNYNKILNEGHLQLNYELRYDLNKRTSGSIQNIVKNEEFQIDNIKQNLLKYPYVIEESIEVRDISAVIIYEKNVDYIVINRGIFTEIQRILGGRIQNNSKVYVNYIAENPANYNYDLVAHNLFLKLSMFENKVDFYTHIYTNDFVNIQYSKYAVLNKIYSSLFGLQFKIDEIVLGYEFNSHNSDIQPYISNYFFLRYTKHIFSGLLMSVNSNYHNYFYTQSDENNQFIDANIRMTYRITDKSNLNVDVGFVNQQANNFNSNFFNFRIEYGLSIAQMVISAGLDYYHRKVESYQNDYRGIFIKVERIF